MVDFSDRTVGWEGFGKGFMANDDYFDMITLLGISGTSPPRDLLELGESEDGDSGREGVSQMTQMIRRSLGLNPRPPYIPIENPPFFITVKPSEKGKKAGVKEREDGLYLGDIKISDREILVK